MKECPFCGSEIKDPKVGCEECGYVPSKYDFEIDENVRKVFTPGKESENPKKENSSFNSNEKDWGYVPSEEAIVPEEEKEDTGWQYVPSQEALLNEATESDWGYEPSPRALDEEGKPINPDAPEEETVYREFKEDDDVIVVPPEEYIVEDNTRTGNILENMKKDAAQGKPLGFFSKIALIAVVLFLPYGNIIGIVASITFILDSRKSWRSFGIKLLVLTILSIAVPFLLSNLK